MVSVKFMSTPTKAAGPGCVTFYDPIVVSHKAYLSGYVAIYELAVHHKRILPDLISRIVKTHLF